MPNNHRVTMESKDGHIYIYDCNTETKREAAVKAKQSITDKGWEQYEYVIVSTTFLEDEIEPMELSVSSDVINILKGK